VTECRIQVRLIFGSPFKALLVCHCRPDRKNAMVCPWQAAGLQSSIAKR